jgi:hypothetical protein
MPFKKDKIANFGAKENSTNINVKITRQITLSQEAQSTPSPTPAPVSQVQTSVTPATYGLHEGDFIRAEGDIDVYIVNDFGYKRLILNPEICLQYGHLGARGCFSAVKLVSPQVRDAFTTSWYVSNGETNDGFIYKLVQTDSDHAKLQQDTRSFADFTLRGMDIHSVFFINSREQNSYPKS